MAVFDTAKIAPSGSCHLKVGTRQEQTLPAYCAPAYKNLGAELAQFYWSDKALVWQNGKLGHPQASAYFFKKAEAGKPDSAFAMVEAIEARKAAFADLARQAPVFYVAQLNNWDAQTVVAQTSAPAPKPVQTAQATQQDESWLYARKRVTPQAPDTAQRQQEKKILRALDRELRPHKPAQQVAATVQKPLAAKAKRVTTRVATAAPAASQKAHCAQAQREAWERLECQEQGFTVATGVVLPYVFALQVKYDAYRPVGMA